MNYFFRALIFGPNETALAQSRLRALAEEIGLTPLEAENRRDLAENFTRQIAPFDGRVAAIKEKHLPNLN